MKVSGTSQLSADRAAVWRALNDPAVLVRTIPGCQRLEAVGDDAFKMTIAAGVGSIRGVYDGQVRLSDQQEPGSFRMHAHGAGASGTIGAEVMVTLAEGAGGGTELTYDADATVGGMVGGVGQRMLTGVSKKMAAEFFANVGAALAGGLADAPAAALPGGTGPSNRPRSSVARLPGPSTADPAPPVRPSAEAVAGQVFTAPAAGATSNGTGFARGVAVGAAAALAGAMVGARIAGRRR